MPDRPSTDLSTPVKFGDVVREVNEHDRTPIENGLKRYIGPAGASLQKVTVSMCQET